MQESKIELTERLRREERWSEASAFKDEYVKKLRAEGMKRALAVEQAWEKMAELYPPLPVIEPVQPDVQPAEELADVELAALLKKSDDNGANLVRDTLWVYQNLENHSAQPSDAPGLGAWSLLKWAREYRNRFFEQILPKAMAAELRGEGEKRRHKDMGIEEVERILEQVTGGSKQSGEKE
jgi:hypothetical protein